jgi:hypothetical protein
MKDEYCAQIDGVFGVRRLDAALVVLSGSTNFRDEGTPMGFLSDYYQGAEADSQSGVKPPHSKGYRHFK